MQLIIANIDFYTPTALELTLQGLGAVYKTLSDVTISGKTLTCTLTAAELSTLGTGNITVGLRVYSPKGTASAKMLASMADLQGGTIITEMMLQSAAEQGGNYKRNLLINPWFTVNQRGSETYTGEGYGFDGWKAVNPSYPNDVSVARSAGQITAKCVGGADFPRLVQVVEEWKQLKGETVTFSVHVLSLSGGAFRLQMYDGVNTFTSSIGTAGVATLTAKISDNATRLECRIIIRNTAGTGIDNTIVFDKAKLETGSYSTLLDDDLPDYETELIRCMRYYQRITSTIPAGAQTASYYIFGFGAAVSATIARLNISLTVPMRDGASAKIHSLYILRDGMTASSAASSASVEAQSSHGLRVSFATTGLTAKETVYAQVNHTGYMELTAEM